MFIDGEYYLDVIKWVIYKFGDVCCVVFLGGIEKIGSLKVFEDKIGVFFYYFFNYFDVLKRVVFENDVEEVVDLSDEFVLMYEDWFRIVFFCMFLGVIYRGVDFMFILKLLKKIKKLSILIIGIGKRVGKIVVSGFVVRIFKEVVCLVVVIMGRGGFEEFEFIEGEKIELIF